MTRPAYKRRRMPYKPLAIITPGRRRSRDENEGVLVMIIFAGVLAALMSWSNAHPVRMRPIDCATPPASRLGVLEYESRTRICEAVASGAERQVERARAE